LKPVFFGGKCLSGKLPRYGGVSSLPLAGFGPAPPLFLKVRPAVCRKSGSCGRIHLSAAYGVAMKKALTVILAVLMLLFAAGCYRTGTYDGMTRYHPGGTTRARAYDGFYHDSLHYGALRGTERTPDGTMRGGTMRGGAMRDGAMHGGAMRSGTRAHHGGAAQRDGAQTQQNDGAMRGTAQTQQNNNTTRDGAQNQQSNSTMRDGGQNQQNTQQSGNMHRDGTHNQQSNMQRGTTHNRTHRTSHPTVRGLDYLSA